MKLETGENIICLVTYGSHLYGTATENSDKDFRGIFMPLKQDIILNRKVAPKRPGVDDTEYFSIYRFIDLALQGQTIALDMLFAPEEAMLISSPVWEKMQENKERFLFKDMSAFVGFARDQAKKYSVKGNRLNEADAFLRVLDSTDPEARMITIWDELPVGLYLEYTDDDIQGIPQYRALNRILKATYKVSYVKEMISGVIADYGNRARKAKKADGADWKALSHAVRAPLEVIELYRNRTITFPLKNRKLILKIKKGEMPFRKVINLIDDLVVKTERDKNMSGLPEAPDIEFWENFLYLEIMEYLKE